jgi:hypothetical protein
VVRIELIGHDPTFPPQLLNVVFRLAEPPPAGAQLLQVVALRADGETVASGVGFDLNGSELHASDVKDAILHVTSPDTIASIAARFVTPKDDDTFTPVEFEGCPRIRKSMLVNYDGMVLRKQDTDTFHKPSCYKARTWKRGSYRSYQSAEVALNDVCLPCSKCLEDETEWVIEELPAPVDAPGTD